MKNSKSFILSALALVVLGIYLFVDAPPPLEEKKVEQFTIKLEQAMEILARENDYARALYTESIVAPGKQRKIEFEENWEEEDVVAGPLPAQFLRLTSLSLERNPMPLGLFLGSDFAINSANNFEGAQYNMFQEMKKTREPVFFFVEDSGRYAYMAPDFAIGKPCITCHNEHVDSPKTDWVLQDVMGATTWTYPNGEVGYKEMLDMIVALRSGFSDAYKEFLNEVRQMPNPPEIGTKWPSDGYFVPDLDVFMAELGKRSSKDVLDTLMPTTKPQSSLDLAGR